MDGIPRPEVVAYGKFTEAAEAGKVESIVTDANRITRKYVEGTEGPPRFVVNRVEPKLARLSMATRWR